MPTDTELLDFLEARLKSRDETHVYPEAEEIDDFFWVEGCDRDFDPSATAIVRPTLRECLIEAINRSTSLS